MDTRTRGAPEEALKNLAASLTAEAVLRAKVDRIKGEVEGFSVKQEVDDSIKENGNKWPSEMPTKTVNSISNKLLDRLGDAFELILDFKDSPLKIEALFLYQTISRLLIEREQIEVELRDSKNRSDQLILELIKNQRVPKFKL